MATTQMNNETTRTGPLDTLGRPVRDLRISVIDNCNLRCTYCMPLEKYGERYEFLPEDELLSFDEIVRLTRLFVQLGVNKVRLTGGEPLLRRNLPALVERIAGIDGVEDIALTTNALLLRKQARALKDAGLSRITVSLDALDDEVVGKMNGRGVPVEPVLDGIAAAQEEGFEDIKLNTVVQRGVNDGGLVEFVDYFRKRNCIVRFIEYMDVGNRNGWRLDHVVPSKEIRDEINATFPLRPLQQNYHGEVASRYAFEDGVGEVGFVSSVTAPFCSSCTRARLSADGGVYTCLFAGEGHDFRTPLRAGEDDEQIFERLRALWKKRDDRYSERRAAMTDYERHRHKVEMYQIGG